MHLSGKTSWWTRVKRRALALDSWLDASLYDLAQRGLDVWRRYVSFMDGFAARGVARVAADLACEALTLSVAGGILMLALAVPAFRETSGDNWLKKQDLAVTFLDRYGHVIGRRGIRTDDSMRLEDYPDYFLKAVIATEDRRFYDHWGLDPIGTLRALTANARASGVVQGGSTLTQQLAKNLFLSNKRTLDRKIKEAFLALFLESRLTKNEILKLYLDRMYMGGGNFGVAAASEFYFGKSARDLTLAEAAMLAGLFKAPTKYAPHINLPAARARANDVLSNLVDAGCMTEGQVAAARRNPATAIDRKQDTSPDYYLDWAFDQMQKLADDGKLKGHRVLTVKTAFDPGIQKSAETSIENNLSQFGKEKHVSQAATVVMEPDGAVRAMVGGRDYGESQFNRATDALRQPGSSFKPYVYATALATIPHLRPSTIVTDTGVCIGNWCPRNYSGGHRGAMPLIVALVHSINSIPVKLSIQIGQALGIKDHVGKAAHLGRQKIVELCRELGITAPLTDTVSLPIGAGALSVIEQTAGYAAFANGGRRVYPYAAIEIRDGRGDIIWRHDKDAPRGKQVIATKVVEDMNYMMSHVVLEGTGQRARIEGVTVAGKTGTTNAYRDAWFCGFTGNYVAAVWMGNDDYTSTNRLTGGNLPAQTWHDMMEPIHRGIDLKRIPGITPEGTPAPLTAQGPGGIVSLAGAPIRQGALTHESAKEINAIGNLFEQAATPPDTTGSVESVQSDWGR